MCVNMVDFSLITFSAHAPLVSLGRTVKQILTTVHRHHCVNMVFVKMVLTTLLVNAREVLRDDSVKTTLMTVQVGNKVNVSWFVL